MACDREAMLTSNSLFAHGTELPVCWSWADDALAWTYEEFPRNVEAFSMHEGRDARPERVSRPFWAMKDFLYFCPTCKTIYEIVRHRIRPPAEPICRRCQQDLPIADEGDWLTYRQMRPRFERIE